jgi:ketoreductase RED2
MTEQRVAVITGGSQGIGAGLVEAYRRREWAVVANAHTIKPGDDPGIVTVAGDIADAATADRIVAAAIDRFGRLDTLVNNAGTTEVIPHHDLEAASVDVWRRIFEVNVFGTWSMTLAALPALRAAQGSVVNVASVAGLRPTGSSIPYAASKAALHHMTVLLAKTVGPEVRVNAVAPGLIDTPWTADWGVVREFVEAVAPLKRVGQPQDVAEVILSLAQSSYVTGQVVAIDGGLSIAT